jgi:hypothetical protein
MRGAIRVHGVVLSKHRDIFTFYHYLSCIVVISLGKFQIHTNGKANKEFA